MPRKGRKEALKAMKKFIVTREKTETYIVIAESESEAINCLTEPEHFASKGSYAMLMSTEESASAELAE